MQLYRIGKKILHEKYLREINIYKKTMSFFAYLDEIGQRYVILQ